MDDQLVEKKYWTAKEKYKIIKPALELEISMSEITRNTGLSNGMINNWIRVNVY